MQEHKKNFIEFLLAQNVLLFGEYILKSGRKSPYFFNAGLFNTGESLATLGGYYARALRNANVDYDVLFGPAYKGIPLVSATAIAMASLYNQATPFAFDRKEKKDHGEGGSLVGSPIDGKKVIMVDDVISAGTATRQTVDILQKHNASLAGIVIALDRQEVGTKNTSAIQEIQAEYNIPVIAVITLADLIYYLEQDDTRKHHLQAMRAYKQQYGINI
jgi:orotate phosphoribosyltransferase